MGQFVDGCNRVPLPPVGVADNPHKNAIFRLSYKIKNDGRPRCFSGHRLGQIGPTVQGDMPTVMVAFVC